MRLIDADAYKEYICRNCTDVGFDFYGAKDISKCPCWKVLDIDYCPTAYNVEKVVEELEYMKRFYYCTDYYRVRIGVDYGKAIDVVRRGGIDEIYGS